MNDTISFVSAWGPAHSRLAAEDAARNEHLRIACGLNLPRAVRLDKERADRLAAEEAARQRREARRNAKSREQKTHPRWPSWARALEHRQPGHCAACAEALHYRNATGICGKCSGRAGRDAPRMRAALAEYLGGQP